jgi:hypothetical protein
MDLTVRRSIPRTCEIVCTHQDRPWDHPFSDTVGGNWSFPEVKRPGLGVHFPPPSSSEVKERVELYLYLRSVPSWQVIMNVTFLPLLTIFQDR